MRRIVCAERGGEGQESRTWVAVGPLAQEQEDDQDDQDDEDYATADVDACGERDERSHGTRLSSRGQCRDAASMRSRSFSATESSPQAGYGAYWAFRRYGDPDFDCLGPDVDATLLDFRSIASVQRVGHVLVEP